MTKDILKQIQNKIQENIKEDLKSCEKEQDPIKKTKLIHKMQIKMMRQIIHHITAITDEEFVQIYNEMITIPSEKQFKEFIKNEKILAYDNLENVEEFEAYTKIRNLELQHNNNSMRLLDEFDFDKKSLERLLLFYITALGQTAIEQRLTNLQLYPLIESSLLVNRLFGFDINWLMGMSMIQLHENMIKMKYSHLGGIIQKNESLSQIIPKLIVLVKNKENREVAFSLDMSHGIKQIRNRLTHEGFKHKISPKDLNVILKEIKRLEQALFPTKP